MAATIKIKNSSTTGAVPTSGDLVQGELAVNVTDTGLYTENASGTVVKLNAPSIDDKNTGATKHLTISTGGNLGLGVTPSAWGSPFKAFQFGSNGGSINYRTDSNQAVEMALNWYYDGTTSKYINTNWATRYRQFSGAHEWYTAASGTAGNAITFTQAMTLDASGNLGVGTTSPSYKVDARLSGTSSGAVIQVGNTSSGGFGGLGVSDGGAYPVQMWGAAIAFLTGNSSYGSATERARIDSSGNLLVGTTTAKTKLQVEGGQFSVGSTGATSQGIYLYINNALSDNSYLSRGSAGTGTTTWYIGNQAITTSSDIRLKDNVKPTERNAVELLNQWEIIDHTWNDPSDQCENNRNSRGVWTGISAQQVQQVTPWLVNKPTEDVNEDGSINPWTMDFGYAVPLLVKAIQEQQALIASQSEIITQLQAQLTSVSADVAALKG